MATYIVIDGVKYDRPLKELADSLIAGGGDGRISGGDAEQLWGQAFDDAKVTKVERRTLIYILDNYNCTNPAKTFLQDKLYKVIDDVFYDQALLQTADGLVDGQGDGRISFDDAGIIWGLADADGKISEVESRTIRYICQNYNCTSKASEWLEKQLSTGGR